MLLVDGKYVKKIVSLHKLIKRVMNYTISITENKDGWLTGQCEQLPQAISQGKDLDDLMENMKDAIETVLEYQKCTLDRVGKHPIYKNRITGAWASVPSHPDIREHTVFSICKQLGIPKPKIN